jgi:hypothetical protein
MTAHDPEWHHGSVDPALEARIVERRALYYRDGAQPAADRPAHVRAGSSLARVPAGIAVVQDDANFVAVVDIATGTAAAIELPRGRDGARQFDDLRGNKRWKLDLEACFAVETGADTRLIVLGSGSSPRRERIVVIDWTAAGAVRVTCPDGRAWFAGLRQAWAEVGASINIEGAVVLGNRIRLLSRGTGRPQGGKRAINSTCDIDRSALLAYLAEPLAQPPPSALNVWRYELGFIDEVALGFTDATPWRDTWLYAATAEDTADAVDDGRVAGSVIGVVDPEGDSRWTVVTLADGRRLTGKIEGIAADPRDGDRLLAVLDADDPALPSVLCTLELRGPWDGGGRS